MLLNDSINCFKKLKVGGYMIFDDCHWGENQLPIKECPQLGIDNFLEMYKDKIENIGEFNYQHYIKKVND